MIESGNRACRLPAFRWMRKTSLVLVLGLLACRNSDDSAESAPPLTMRDLRGTASLDLALASLEQELNAAIRGDGDLDRRLARAEAITDRLLETQLPFPWLTETAYGVEPMLRQIQVLADRVVAACSRAVRCAAGQDLRDLYAKVRAVRVGLRGKGGPAPLLLDSLLARYAADSLWKATDAGE
jgi:hypothetical protein